MYVACYSLLYPVLTCWAPLWVCSTVFWYDLTLYNSCVQKQLLHADFPLAESHEGNKGTIGHMQWDSHSTLRNSTTSYQETIATKRNLLRGMRTSHSLQRASSRSKPLARASPQTHSKGFYKRGFLLTLPSFLKSMSLSPLSRSSRKVHLLRRTWSSPKVCRCSQEMPRLHLMAEKWYIKPHHYVPCVMHQTHELVWCIKSMNSWKAEARLSLNIRISTRFGWLVSVYI